MKSKHVLRCRALATRWAILASGTTLILGDCDPTIQATVEDGIIDTTSALIGSFFQAILQVGLNAATA